jgi:hypothetical protein
MYIVEFVRYDNPNAGEEVKKFVTRYEAQLFAANANATDNSRSHQSVLGEFRVVDRTQYF